MRRRNKEMKKRKEMCRMCRALNCSGTFGCKLRRMGERDKEAFY